MTYEATSENHQQYMIVEEQLEKEPRSRARAVRKEEDRFSFSSANTFPMKIFLHESLIRDCIENHRVHPVHLQLNPTNWCNQSCPFCSCSARDRELELPLKAIDGLLGETAKLGTRSVTITGEGEPTLHPAFNEIVSSCVEKDIEVGLVSNGTLLSNISDRSFATMTWIRLSASDYLPIDTWITNLSKKVEDHPSVDWSFSYVATSDSNPDTLQKLIEFGNAHDFTHIRVVSDILEAHKLGWKLRALQRFMSLRGVDDGKVNYQARGTWTEGHNPCYLSILKPVIGADGYIYPCCGTQYALESPSRDYEKKMRMGHIDSFEELVEGQGFFDGSMCYKCFYSEYNQVLGVLLNGVKH